MDEPARPNPRKARGACSNPAGRFATTAAQRIDDGWGSLDEPLPALATEVTAEAARSIVTRNSSPDIPFDRSINPYRGCEHGCVYCYARPAHAYVDLSPGLDFETRLFYKPQAAELLRRTLSAPGYRCAPIALGANTDPYQPIERRYRVTRSILEVLSDFDHPVTIVTKGAALIERDIELLSSLASRRLVSVAISLTTLDPALKRTLEPRAASPAARLAAMRGLTAAGVPTAAMIAPVIPALTDHELEALLEAAALAGCRSAAYVVLRLPHEVESLFEEWLSVNEPLKAARVMARMREYHAGRSYDATFGLRQRGRGAHAQLLARRFERACRRLGLDQGERIELDTQRFEHKRRASETQMSLF
ncbi:MAG TPA: PA0069 family radical SAM protein [Gammaproteobacteria bacterium]|nr:PA0069 family radical SAM protein [Gammaproteobacteria bacterium]